jgi:hypothetical protein
MEWCTACLRGAVSQRAAYINILIVLQCPRGIEMPSEVSGRRDLQSFGRAGYHLWKAYRH